MFGLFKKKQSLQQLITSMPKLPEPTGVKGIDYMIHRCRPHVIRMFEPSLTQVCPYCKKQLNREAMLCLR